LSSLIHNFTVMTSSVNFAVMTSSVKLAVVREELTVQSNPMIFHEFLPNYVSLRRFCTFVQSEMSF